MLQNVMCGAPFDVDIGFTAAYSSTVLLLLGVCYEFMRELQQLQSRPSVNDTTLARRSVCKRGSRLTPGTHHSLATKQQYRVIDLVLLNLSAYTAR